jgi:hypothetical protein
MTKPLHDNLLLDVLIGELKIRHFGYTNHTTSSLRIRELLWDFHDIYNDGVYLMSVEFEKQLLLWETVSMPRIRTGEHSTPVKVIIDECLKIYRDYTFYDSELFKQELDSTLSNSLRAYLASNLSVVHITEQENKMLNSLGMSQSTPVFEDRYSRAGIEISDTVLIKDGSEMRMV